jgi:WD40 repeat protein
VFISYAREDRNFVRRLHRALDESGRDSWVDWEDIPPTAEWLAEIYRAIEGAQAILFVIAPDSACSRVCALELAHAIRHHKRLIPIVRRTTDVDSVPDALAAMNWIFLREEDDFDVGVRVLLEALDTDFEWVRAHTRILARAIEWDGRSREGSLLLRGRDLADAGWWLVGAAGKQPSPTPLQSEYLAASRCAATRRLRTMAVTAALALVALASLGVVAYYQARSAEAERRDAERKLAGNLIAEGDTKGVAGRWSEAKADFVRARAILEKLDESAVPAELAIWDAYRHSPPPLLALHPHKAAILDARFCGGGLTAISGARDRSLTLWDVLTGAQRRRLDTGDPFQLAVSHDCQRALSAGARDEHLRLWNVEEGRLVHSFVAHRYGVESLAFSPDGQWAISGGMDKVARVWDLAGAKELASFRGHTAPVGLVRIDTRRQLALSAGTTPDETVRIWRVPTGKQVHEYAGVSYSAEFSPDSNLALIGLSSGVLQLVETTSGRRVRSFVGHTDAVRSISFSPDGRLALSGGDDRTVRLWEVANGKELLQLTGHDSAVTSVSFSPDAQTALSGDGDGRIRTWHLAGTMGTMAIPTDGQFTESVALSAGGTLATSAGSATSVRVWDTATGKEVAALYGHHARPSAVAFSADERWLLSGSHDRTLKLWDLEVGRAVKSFPGHRGRIRAVEFSNPGGFVSLDWEGDEIRVWDASTGLKSVTNAKRKSAVAKVDQAGEPHGDLQVHVIDPASKKVVTSIPARSYGVGDEGIAISPDGRRGAAVGAGNDFVLWDITTGATVRTFSGHGDPVAALDFSPDGRLVLSGSDDRTLRLWGADSGAELRRFSGHTGSVRSVAFSPDGRLAISGSSDGTIRTWQIDTGREMRIIARDLTSINSVSFAPKRLVAISGESGGGVRIWDFNSVRRVSELEPGVAAASARLASIPEDGASLAALGEWYAFRGAWALARATLVRAKAAGAEQMPSLALARSHWVRGDLPDALLEFRRAAERREASEIALGLTIRALNAEIALGRAEAHLREARWDKAIALYDELLLAQPDHLLALVQRCTAHLNAQRWKNAIDDCTRAAGVNPRCFGCFFYRGLALDAQGDQERALADYRKALELQNDYVPAMMAAAEIQLRVRALESAIRLLQAAVQIEPTSSLAAYNLACAFSLRSAIPGQARAGDMSTALGYLERAVQLGYNDFTHMARDSDLNALRNEERYQRLLRR